MRLKYIVISLIIAFTLNAQNSKIRNLESQRKKTIEDIEITTKILDQTSDSKKNVLDRLNLLSQQIKSRKEVITLLNSEIECMNEDIAAIENEIDTLKTELESKKSSYAKSLQHMSFLKNGQDKLLFILAGDDFAQSYRRMRYLKEYADWQKKQGTEISEKQAELKTKNQMLTASKINKLALIQQKEKEENNLQKEEDQKQDEVKTLTAKEKDLQKDLDKKKKQAEELNRQIEKAIATEIARANAEAEKIRIANEKAEKTKNATSMQEERQAESAGGYAMTKEERQLSSDFASNQGRLPFPLKGSYRITNHFGQQKPEGLQHVTLNNNGIDIQTTPNNEAKSIFGGEISKVFMVPGYNNSVIVRHGNYLTVYCNLAEVYVKVNDKVRAGQALGKIFTDYEDGSATILHFELWKETIKLNPEGWLNR